MKKFFIRITVYVSIIAAITLAVNICYICVDPEYNSMNVPENIQICNFGSSHGQRGFNYEDFKGRYICSNFGLSSQSLLYDYRILKHYQNNLQPDAAVFIVLSYFSFFGSPEFEGKDFFSKNKRYYRFLPPELILQYDWKTDLYVNYFPCLSPSGLVVFMKNILGIDRDAKIFEDNFNLYDKGWNIVTDAHNAALDAPAAYSRHIETRFDGSGRRLRRQEAFDAVYGMIGLCRQLGARPILVTVPYMREYTDTIRKNAPEFFSDFYAVIEEIQRKTGAEYYDYAFDERFCGNYSLFINSDHMNREGARRFTNTLLREVLGIDAETP